MKKYKQLSFEDLVKIETLMKEDFKSTEIAINSLKIRVVSIGVSKTIALKVNSKQM